MERRGLGGELDVSGLRQIRAHSVRSAVGRLSLALLLGAARIGSMATQASAAGLQSRPADPIVLLGGSRLPSLVGAHPTHRVIAFRWAGGWQQVPVELPATNAPTWTSGPPTTSRRRESRHSPTPTPARSSAPTRTRTWTADDQVAMMARDSGSKASGGHDPSGTRGAGSGVEVKLSDPLAQGKVGLSVPVQERRVARPLRRAALRQLRLRSPLRRLQADLRHGPAGRTRRTRTSTPPTTTSTSRIAGSMTGCGSMPAAPAASTSSIGTRTLAPGNCVRSEDTFYEAARAPSWSTRVALCGRFAPTWEPNSGPYTERQHIFYDRREDITTFLQGPRDPGGDGLLRLLAGGRRDGLSQQLQPGRRAGRRRPRQARPPGRRLGSRSAARRAGSRSSTR